MKSVVIGVAAGISILVIAYSMNRLVPVSPAPTVSTKPPPVKAL